VLSRYVSVGAQGGNVHLVLHGSCRNRYLLPLRVALVTACARCQMASRLQRTALTLCNAGPNGGIMATVGGLLRLLYSAPDPPPPSLDSDVLLKVIA
jgi:hypothetical protein